VGWQVNNLVPHPKTAEYKSNFLRIKRAAFFGSSGDTCINPQLSRVFEFLSKDQKTWIPMKESQVYAEDTFGLASMDKRGDLVIKAPPGYGHMAWLGDQTLWDTCVVPLLAAW